MLFFSFMELRICLQMDSSSSRISLRTLMVSSMFEIGNGDDMFMEFLLDETCCYQGAIHVIGSIFHHGLEADHTFFFFLVELKHCLKIPVRDFIIF